jgi:iron complex outermembrane receptor protein
MLNVELGWQRHSKNHMVSVNYYLMDYHNQLVMTGAVNDVGNPIRMNVDRSQRMGIEAEAAWRPSEHWQLAANATVSRNQIQQLVTETTDYADYSVVRDTLTRVPLSFSPAVIAAASITYMPGRDWSLIWNHKYTGKQYLDNTGNEDKALNAFYLSECVVQKNWKFRSVTLQWKFQVQNLFNSKVYNNGYTYEYFYGSGALTREVFLFPTATRNFMTSLQLKF